mgnify:CR=1 FL=1
MKNTIWKQHLNLEELQKLTKGSAVEHLGILYTYQGRSILKASMQVGPKTMQPFGILHGGASAFLAETLASTASYCCIDPTKNVAVGMQLNIHHLSPATKGVVEGSVIPIRLGRSVHLWEVSIEQEKTQIALALCTVKIQEKA